MQLSSGKARLCTAELHGASSTRARQQSCCGSLQAARKGGREGHEKTPGVSRGLMEDRPSKIKLAALGQPNLPEVDAIKEAAYVMT